MDLSGPWRAHLVDDDLRRAAVESGFADDGWPTVSVPGHWQQTPEFATTDGPLLYRHRFHSPLPTTGQRRWVVFEGIFYQADVWLDGAYLGDPEGYFFPHRYDITSLARLTEEHLLAVEVTCAPEPPAGNRRNITGAFQSSEAVPSSWNPGGLWAPVRLVDTGPVAIDRFRVLCRDADARRAHLRLAASLDSDDARRVVVRTRVDGVLLASTEHALAAGVNDIAWALDVPEPRLWWPRALGAAELSDVTVEVLADGDISDTTTRRTGFRQVSLSDWKCAVNGERLFLKGVNVSPTRPGLATIDPGLAAADMRQVAEAGLDCVRLQGHIAAPETYAAADELGIVVLQDFPLTWSYGRHIRRAATHQARAMVDTLGHHPSIVQWCAHDEPVSESSQLAADERQPRWRRVMRQQLPTWNKTVLDRWVKRAIESADGTRPTVAHSGVLPHFPQLAGTSTHVWLGWHEGAVDDLRGLAKRLPRLVRFLGEFGAQSAPLTLTESVPELDGSAWPDVDWEHLRREHGLDLATMLDRHPPGDHPDFASWARATQTYQADLLRAQIELLRTLKYRPAGGFSFSSLADATPMISSAVLDHQRRPKSALAAVAEACRPVIVTTVPPPPEVVGGTVLELPLHVVNDLRVAVRATVAVAVTYSNGAPTQRRSYTGTVDADDVAGIGTVRLTLPTATTDALVAIRLDGRPLAEGDELDSDVATPTATPEALQIEYRRHLSLRVSGD